jgi:pyruvate, water dikinase
VAAIEYIKWFKELSSGDIKSAGGKNASLGEMVRNLKASGIKVPDGFVTTADAYWDFIDNNNLRQLIKDQVDAYKKGENLGKVGKKIRRLITDAEFSGELKEEILKNYKKLSMIYEEEEADVAVRSSATAEDLPDASFAGQQETFLNISGQKELLEACKKCFASLFTDRAISYREEKGFDHMKIALSVGIQKMVRSDMAGAGVAFTLDTDSGFPGVVQINASWGLGENVVKGTVNPDEYTVFKPLLQKEGLNPIIKKYPGNKEKKLIYCTGCSQTTKNVDTSSKERKSFVLSDMEILLLAKWAVTIEKHYGRPMDIEWAKDGKTGEIFIVQARPETVQSQKSPDILKSYSLKEKGRKIISGKAIGSSIISGKAQVIESVHNISRFKKGSILVTGMTDPDWVPVMKQARAIVTDHGGRTSHAAIVSRELGKAAIVGTVEGTKKIKEGQEITVSCAEGDEGYVYEGLLDYKERELKLEDIPTTKTKIMINIASPAAAVRWWPVPCSGIGLARMEFIINNIIKIHPMALVKYGSLQEGELKRQIDEITENYKDKTHYFIEHLAWGLAQIASTRYPDPVVVRMSDFKTNEYANLIGGSLFEPEEENPMLGFRGASRYYSSKYIEGFALECAAVKKAREEIGLDNIIVMIPFCRTIEEADKVLAALKKNGLQRGKAGLKVYVMAEIPSNILQAGEFAERFDSFSIGSNDLTQLILGVDRDSEELAPLFDERNPSVKEAIKMLIEKAHNCGTTVGICGQGPSDFPDFAEYLVEQQIDSISLNPDSVIETVARIAGKEKSLEKDKRKSAA